MLNQSKRFNEFQFHTSTSVGPGTYTINGGIGTDIHGFAPFLSMKPRDLSLHCRDSANLPSPDHYYPHVKSTITGGQSMQSRTPRFNNLKYDVPGPCDYSPYSDGAKSGSPLASPRSGYSGKLVRAPKRNKDEKSMPDGFSDDYIKAFCGYEERCGNHSVENNQRQFGKCYPCLLHGGLELGGYKGVNFGKMTSRGSFVDTTSEPGPGDYDIGPSTLYVPIPYTNKKWLKLLCGRTLQKIAHNPVKCGDSVTPGIIRNPDDLTLDETTLQRHPDVVLEQPRSMRYLDSLVQKALRENFPAPNSYNVTKENLHLGQIPRKTLKKRRVAEESEEVKWKREFVESVRKKIHFKRRNIEHFVELPFISSIPRFKSEETGPGPGDYDVSSFGDETGECPIGVAFLRRSERFKSLKTFQTPGPGDYNKMGMVDELRKRLVPRPCMALRDPPKNLGFGSSAPRVTGMVSAWAKGMPGPSDYDTAMTFLTQGSAASQSIIQWLVNPFISESTRDLQKRQCSWKTKNWVCSRRKTVPVRVVHTAEAIEHGRSKSVSEGETKEQVAEWDLIPTVAFRKQSNLKQVRRGAKTKKPLFNPFEARKAKVEVTPGPALYFPEKAKDRAVLKRGLSVRMDSGTIRFPDCPYVFPGPAHYQTVKSEMLKRSFNVKIKRPLLKPPVVSRVQKKKASRGRGGEGAGGEDVASPRRRLTRAASPPSLGWPTKRFSVSRGPEELF